jgi:hypothetical protein
MMRSPVLYALVLIYLCQGITSCTKIEDKRIAADTISYPPGHPGYILPEPLKVGDRIALFQGYDGDPKYLKHPPDSQRRGEIVKFITGQNEQLAAVVKFDQKFSGDSITGDIAVLELGLVGQTWQQPSPVHIELCDFMPEDKPWKDRRKGEWVEAAASVTLLNPSK